LKILGPIKVATQEAQLPINFNLTICFKQFVFTKSTAAGQVRVF